MFGVAPVVALAILERPATTPLVLATLVVIVGWAYHVWSAANLRPRQPEAAAGDQRPDALAPNAVEPPAAR